MLNFSTFKGHGGFHFISGLEEALSVVDAHLIIVFVDFVAHLHFFDISRVLFFPGFFGSFFLLELVFAVVHNPTDGRIGFVTNENEVEFFFFSQSPTFVRGDESELTAVGIDQPNFGIANSFVDLR